MNDERLDNTFFALVETTKGVDNLIDYFFAFIGRKTDFFTEKDRAFKLVNEAMSEHYETWKTEKDRKEKVAREKAA